MSTFFHWQDEMLVLHLYVQPRASRDEFVGEHGDALKVRITAPPVDGKANDHLARFLADAFKVPRASVVLVAGQTGRRKTFHIRAPRHLPDIFPPA